MLNNEEKNRIKAEEDFRANARAQAEKGMKKRGNPILRFIGGIVVVLFGLGILGAIFSPKSSSDGVMTPVSGTTSNISSKPTTSNKPAPKPKADLELLGDSATTNDFSINIKGKIRNNTDREFSYAQIEYNLYDKNGNQIGSAMANISNFESGKIWAFEAMGLTSDAKTYKFKEITKF